MRSHSCRNRNFLYTRPLDVARVNACSTYATYFQDKNPGKLRLRFFCISRSRLHLWPLYNPRLRIPRIEHFPDNPEYFSAWPTHRNHYRLFSLPKEKIGRTKQRRKLQTRLSWHSQMLNRHHHRIKVCLPTGIRTDDGVEAAPAGLQQKSEATKFIPRRSIDFGLYCLKTWIIFMGATLWFQYSQHSVVRRRSRKITAILCGRAR